MNTKEIGELRRRLRPGKNNIPRILGCYVNEKKQFGYSYMAGRGESVSYFP